MTPLNKILLGIGAGMVVIVAIIIVWLCLANAHLRVALAETQEQATACHLANEAFGRQAQEQNQAISLLKQETEARARNSAAAVRAAQKRAAVFEADAARLQRQKNVGEDCHAAAALMDQAMAGVK